LSFRLDGADAFLDGDDPLETHLVKFDASLEPDL
jgi:hypothetical protein